MNPTSGRGFESTTPATHSNGSDVYGVMTAYSLENYIQEQAPDAAVGGQLTGTVGNATVANTHGASGTQTHHAEAHNLFSASHTGDLTYTDTPGDNELLQYDAGAGKWSAEAASAHGSHGAGAGGRPAFWAVIYRSGSTYLADKYDGTNIASSSTFSTTFNSAAAACSAGGGGQMFLASGIYLVSSSTVPALERGVDLVGEGHWGRIADGGAMTDLYGTVIRSNVASLASCLDVGDDNYGGMVRDICIDGNSNQALVGIRIQAGDQHVIRCGIRAAQNGIRVVDNVTHHVAIRIQDVKVQGCTSNGVLVDSGPTDGLITNSHLLQSSDTGTANVNIGAGGWQISGGHYTEGSSGNGSSAIDSSGGPSIWINNYFDTSTQYGLNIAAGNGSRVANNIFRGHAGGISLRVSGTNWKNINDNRFECNNQSRWAIQYVSNNFTSSFPAGSCVNNTAYLFNTTTAPYGVVGSSANLPVPNGLIRTPPPGMGVNGYWPQFVCDLNSSQE